MARRRKTTPIEDLLEVVALLPWWGGVALAFVSYLILHGIAGQQLTVTTVTGQIAGSVLSIAVVSLAGVAQYLVPILCLFAALGSALRRTQREALISQVATSDGGDPLHDMTWQEFEMLVGEAFRLQGFQVAETGGGGADGGVDLVMRRDGCLYLVQCKQWKAFKVGVTVVREFFGIMAANQATGGFVVTSGRFTAEAAAFATGHNLKLIEGRELVQLIKQAQAVQPVRRQSTDVNPIEAVLQPEPASGTSSKVTASNGSAPSCPICSARMVRRSAKRGPNAGNAFWGCGTFPDCRGIRSFDRSSLD